MTNSQSNELSSENDCAPNTEQAQTIIDANTQGGAVIQGDVNAVGDFIGRDKVTKINISKRVLFLIASVVSVVIVTSAFVLYEQLRPNKPPARMTGEFNVAIAGFAQQGSNTDPDVGMDVARRLYQRFVDSTGKEIKVEVWKPDWVGVIQGSNKEERAKAAEQLSKRINADVLVYGVIDTLDSVSKVAPEFYVTSKDFLQASEVIGQHELGTPITMGQGRAATKILTSEKLTSRIDALSKIVIGLSYYALHDWDRSLDLFQTAAATPNWDESEGKEVLYLLAGNAALKSGKVDAAEDAFKKSLSLQPEYARAYVGLAATYSKRAMASAEATSDLTKIDTSLLDSAIEIYRKAKSAEVNPAHAYIQEKVDFGIGQSILRRALGRGDKTYNDAIEYFKFVIGTNNDDANPGLQELVAQAHAHLALIYSLEGEGPVADEYDKAAELLSTLGTQVFAKDIAFFKEKAKEWRE